ncbi:glucose PTS transporter subunit IIA [Pediococcus ethanolidurans]|uniref:glucose PTS transporter subunit IIA n=1 Tax=Pediococcus ethanolidurans TaxID=319653 RepID=UPI0029544B29|nr:glucose PTS transporter subunit IIA [Pediococcus ethanolidurans]
MFAQSKSEDNTKIVAPVTGKCVDLSQVPDEMFAKRTMGDGAAFIFSGDTIFSPCAGTVKMTAKTDHAVGLMSEGGVELLIHVGVDTVELNGQGLETLVKQEQHVEIGTPLLKIDREFMEKKHVNLITSMVVTNGKNAKYKISGVGQDVEQGESEIIIGTGIVKKGKKKGYADLAQKIIENVGSEQNVINVFHCVTRVRFHLKDEKKANDDAIRNLDGVMDVVHGGGQYQVVIGPAVEDVYNEIIKSGNFKTEQIGNDKNNDNESVENDDEKKGLLNAFLGLMSSIFMPVLGILMASGMIKALLSLLTVSNLLSTKSGTYILLSAVGDALFYFFPVALGWSSAKRFGIKEMYGITLGAILVYPTLVTAAAGKTLYTLFAGSMFSMPVKMTFLGLPVVLQSYSTTVIPIILIVWIASLLYKWFQSHLAAVMRPFFVPFLTILIAAPLGLMVFGPIAMLLQDAISKIVIALIDFNPGIAGLVLGTFWSVLVVFGLHWAVIPMFAINIAQNGYDIINPLIFAGALASMGSVLAIMILDKRVKERSVAIPAFISSFFGINEPALYGVLLPRKKVMYKLFGCRYWWCHCWICGF